MTRSLLLLPLLALGCATPPTRVEVGNEPRVLWDDAPQIVRPLRPAALTLDEAKEIARAHDAAHACELTARAVRKRSKQDGWAIMQQCVLRADYSDLETLVSQPWLDDLSASGRNAELVAHVIAVRGGDVHGDLRILRRRKIPVFSLQAALAEPSAYRGRLVIMRGSPRGGRTADGVRALRIVETKVMAESEWVPSGPRERSTHEMDTRDSTSGSTRAGFAERTRRTDGPVVEVLHNVNVETGHEVLTSLEGDAPFLESHTDYVLVLRFDGTREVVNGTEIDEQAIATVVGYHEPESGLFARLGR